MAHDPTAKCLCAADHRPPVLEYTLHEIWPQYVGGPTTPDNQMWLCPTSLANVHECLRLMFKAGRVLTDTELHAIEHPRPVSRYAAGLAREGYRRYTESLTTPQGG